MGHLEYKEFYRRNLPHWQPLGGTLFVTCCLSGSIPQSTLDWYKKAKRHFLATASAFANSERAERELELQRQWFARIEGALHKAEVGPTWLKDERVAKLVTGNLHFHDGKTYRLDAYCVMANHAHLVFTPLEILDPTTAQAGSLRDDEREPRYYSLAKIMHSFKSYTSNESNKILGRRSEFWQHESHDRVIRDDQEWERVIAYVINNPVKAGLVAQWQDWPYTYVRTPT